ncbi:lens fiber membrane intrinsic protein-like [Glandiceps talaboti]
MSRIQVVVGLAVSAVAAICYIVSTATDYWFVIDLVGGSLNTGLWRECTTSDSGIHVCVALLKEDLEAFVNCTRVFMVTACLVCVGALILGVYAVITNTVNKVRIVSGCFIALTGIFVLIGTLWYGLKTMIDDHDLDYKFGYSIILGWVSIPLAVVGGGVIARKMAADNYETLD